MARMARAEVFAPDEVAIVHVMDNSKGSGLNGTALYPEWGYVKFSSLLF